MDLVYKSVSSGKSSARLFSDCPIKRVSTTNCESLLSQVACPYSDACTVRAHALMAACASYALRGHNQSRTDGAYKHISPQCFPDSDCQSKRAFTTNRRGPLVTNKSPSQTSTPSPLCHKSIISSRASTAASNSLVDAPVIPSSPLTRCSPGLVVGIVRWCLLVVLHKEAAGELDRDDL